MGRLDLTPEQLAAAVGQPQAAQMVIAQPFNDVQLIAMIAGEICGGNRGVQAPSAVETAIEIVGEAMIQFQANGIGKAMDKAKKRLQLLNGSGQQQ